MTTAQPARRQRRVTALSADVTPLAQGLLDLAPEPVRRASEEHRAALEQLDAARHEARLAGEAVGQAAGADGAAARSAVERGKVPPATTVPKATDAADRAARGAAAAEQLARESQARLLGALQEHLADFHAAVDERRGDLASQASRHVDLVEDALAELAGLRMLRDALHRESLGGRYPLFKAQLSRRQLERNAARSAAKNSPRPLDDVRAQLDGHA